MKNPLIYLLLLLILFACKVKKNIDPFPPKINQLANRYLELGRFSGTILVAEKNKILYHQSYGLADYEEQIPFTKHTSFKIGPITLLFTTYIIEQMATQKLIDLTTPINHYLPEIKNTLTVKAILYQKDIANDSTHHLLGRLIEKQLERPYQQAIEQFLFPLGLNNTFSKKGNSQLAKGYLFHNYRDQGMELDPAPIHEEEKTFSRYGLKSTVIDLWKFSTILNQESIQKSGYLKNDGFSYTFQKDSTLSVIILSNRRHPICSEMANSIQAIYKNQPYELPLLRQIVAINPANYQHYIGTYQVNPNFQFEVIIKNDSLFTVMGGKQTHLIPQSENQFYYQDFDAAIRFVQDSSQNVSKAILYDGFLEGNDVRKL